MNGQVAIIGTGRLGTRLAEQLILDRYLERVSLWNRSQPRLRGTIDSLTMWRDLAEAPTTIEMLNWSTVHTIDLAVIAVKERYDPRVLIETEDCPDWLPRDLRYVGLSRDIHVVREVCQRLMGYKGYVVVVTNPVDMLTALVARWLPSASVIGSGLSLDERRLARELSKEVGVAPSKLRCTLGGEHGGDLIPIADLWDKVSQEFATEPKRLKRLLASVNDFGVRVVRDLGFTLQDAALVIASDIAWLLRSETQDPVRSFAIPRGGTAVGRPVKRDAIRVLSPIDLGQADEALIKERARHIEKIVACASRDWLKSD